MTPEGWIVDGAWLSLDRRGDSGRPNLELVPSETPEEWTAEEIELLDDLMEKAARVLAERQAAAGVWANLAVQRGHDDSAEPVGPPELPRPLPLATVLALGEWSSK